MQHSVEENNHVRKWLYELLAKLEEAQIKEGTKTEYQDTVIIKVEFKRET